MRGKNGSDFNTEYHCLDIGMPWVAAPSLQTPDRGFAAAIYFMVGMWVTGEIIKLTNPLSVIGGQTESIKRLSSTELLKDDVWQYSVNLPNNCLVTFLSRSTLLMPF